MAILVAGAWAFIPADWVGARYVMGLFMWLLPFGNILFGYAITKSMMVLLPTTFLGGAATAFVLHRVHIAFEPQPEPSPPTEEPHI